MYFTNHNVLVYTAPVITVIVQIIVIQAVTYVLVPCMLIFQRSNFVSHFTLK